MPCEHVRRDEGDVSTSQGMPKTVSKPPAEDKDLEQVLLAALR
jgi:hypothetical protein